MPDKVIFTATSGRSGTTTLVDIFTGNVANCTALHEPWIDPTKAGVDPSSLSGKMPGGKLLEGAGFGEALRWYDEDNPLLDGVLKHKARIIRKLNCDVYLEANHAFLKSMCEGMVREFPSLCLVHLTRHPLEVARSFVNKFRDLSNFKVGYALWNVLPGMRKNCLPDLPANATYIQHYVWQWLELELRLVGFLEKFPGTEIVDIDVNELGNATAVESMFHALGITGIKKPLKIPGPANVNINQTRVSGQDLEEACALLGQLPSGLIAKLRQPYDLEIMLQTGSSSCLNLV